MKATTNFTIKSLRANRVRTFVTIMGVALAAALLTAILTSYASLTNFLMQSEIANDGTWMAKVEEEDSATLASQVERAEADPSITGIAELHDIGFAALDQKQRERLGAYQTIVSAEGDIQTVLGVHPEEGRLPENQHEILLWSGWGQFEGVNVGDKITFDVGKRVAVMPDGQSIDVSEAMDAGNIDAEDGAMTTLSNGSALDSSMGFLDSFSDGGSFDEELIDAAPRTYTVVGFYEAGNALFSGVGPTAITGDVPDANAYTQVFVSMDGMKTAQEVKDRAEELFDGAEVELHNALLRYMGISSETSIWSTFYGLVAILAAVILVACISLIFNAFAISVAERRKQFGLLSSVGATRRQLRRTVVLEAFIVAIIGIPLGVLIGLGGCAITFAVLGPSITSMLGARSGVAFELHIEPAVIGFTILLTLVAILLSAWIPAQRASRATIIDSLRASSVSRRGERRASRATDPVKLWKSGGLSGKLFGIGGKLAFVNRKRGATRGTAAAFSLALAIVLLMTAGSFNSFIGSLVSAATGGTTQAGEVGVFAQYDEEAPAPKAPVSPEQMLAAENGQFSNIVSDYQAAYAQLLDGNAAESKGWLMRITVPVVVPNVIAGQAFEKSNAAMEYGRALDNGDYACLASVCYVDDEHFDEYARSIGADPADFHDSSNVRAIGISRNYGNDGNSYQLLETLRSTGGIQVLAGAVYQNRYPVDLTLEMGDDATQETGTTDVRGVLAAFAPSVIGDAAESAPAELNKEDVAFESLDVQIAALAEEPPAIVGDNGAQVQLIVPASLAQSQGFGAPTTLFKAEFDSRDGDHAALAEELSERASECFEQASSLSLSFISVNDHIEEVTSAQMMATIINVFCLLFTIILTLIALANVFNTLTNSLILRRREFAVMRSIGLSNKQFRRMIIDECARFGMAGLIPGLIVSIGVAFLIYLEIGESLSGLTFFFPWGYCALAIVMTFLAMVVSVAYGMHRCKADNIVEALRADSI